MAKSKSEDAMTWVPAPRGGREEVMVWRPERNGGVWQEGFYVVGKKSDRLIVRNVPHGFTELEVEPWRVRAA